METKYRSEIELMETMGDRIRMLRQESGMTQVVIAKRLNVKPTTYNSWERNASMPKHEKVLELADLFETTLDYLYGRTDDRKTTLDEYKMEQMVDNKILSILGLSKEEIAGLSKKDFDRIIDYTKLVIQAHENELKNKDTQ